MNDADFWLVDSSDADLVVGDQLLREKLAHYVAAYEVALVGICFVSPHGKIRMTNKKMQTLLGYSEEELLSMNMNQVTHPDFRDETRRSIQELLLSSATFDNETKYLAKDGSEVWCHTHVTLSKDEEGNVKFLIAVLQDISAQKEMEEEMLAKNRLLETIVQHSPAAIIAVDIKGKVILSNHKANHYGLTVVSADKNNLEFSADSTFHLDKETPFKYDETPIAESLVNKCAVKDVTLLLKTPVTKDEIYVSANAIPLVSKTGEVVGSVGTFVDITELKRIETSKTVVIFEAENKERARIARELHDGLGQTIAAALLFSQSLRRTAEQKLNPEELQKYVKGAKLIERAAMETRVICHTIMPNSLKEFGMIQTLRDLIGTLNDVHDLTVLTLDENLGGKRYRPEIEITIYRVLQEFINNTLRHARAENLFIEVFETSEGLSVRAVDNGVGFEDVEKHGLGLDSMKTRLESIDAKFSFQSQKGRGTSVLIKLKHHQL